MTHSSPHKPPPHQNPGGFILCETLVHFGSSDSNPTSVLTPPNNNTLPILGKLTMHPLPISLLLPIKHRILILWPHLPLRRHLLLPPFEIPRRIHICPLERCVDGCDHVIDEAEAFALATLLGGGEAPGYFPEGRGGQKWLTGEEGLEYQRRPPERVDVGLKGPNIFGRVGRGGGGVVGGVGVCSRWNKLVMGGYNQSYSMTI